MRHEPRAGPLKSGSSLSDKESALRALPMEFKMGFPVVSLPESQVASTSFDLLLISVGIIHKSLVGLYSVGSGQVRIFRSPGRRGNFHELASFYFMWGELV